MTTLARRTRGSVRLAPDGRPRAVARLLSADAPVIRGDMGMPLPCRLAPGTRAFAGAWLSIDLGADAAVLRLAVDGDGSDVVAWAAEPLDAERCDRVDMDAMTGAVRESIEVPA